jgi:hypothetical protein
MYDALARDMLEPASERVARDVRRARERRPHASPQQLAASLIRGAALRSGGAAALAAAPSGWLFLLPVAVDFPFQVLALNRAALSVPQALRRPTTVAERALAAAASLAAASLSVWSREQGIRISRRALADRPPAVRAAVHALIAAGFSAAAVFGIGQAAREYCRRTTAPSRSQ